MPSGSTMATLGFQRLMAMAPLIVATAASMTVAVALPSEDRALEELVRVEEARMEHFWGRVDSTLLGVGAHNQVLGEVAREQDLPLAEVAESIPRDGEHFLDMCHLTAAANQILGSTIADAIALNAWSATHSR